LRESERDTEKERERERERNREQKLLLRLLLRNFLLEVKLADKHAARVQETEEKGRQDRHSFVCARLLRSLDYSIAIGHSKSYT